MTEEWKVHIKGWEETDELFYRNTPSAGKMGKVELSTTKRSVYGQIAQEVANIITDGRVAQLEVIRELSPAITSIRVRLILTRSGFEGVQTRVKRSENSAYFRLNLNHER